MAREMAAMLDELMGAGRDLPAAERARLAPKSRAFSDAAVCKFHLCGFCPFEEFRRTKNDAGECPAAHDDGARAAWEALPDREKERWGYERELLRRLDRLLVDLRRRIAGNEERLRGAARPMFLADDQAALDALAAEASALLARAAALGEAGDVDAAQAAAAAAEGAKARAAALARAADGRAGNTATRGLVQSVCPVSGLIINDEEARLQDHLRGRNYNAWVGLHAAHARLTAALAARARGGGEARPRERSRERRRSRSRSRGRRRRSRSRSRDRRRRSRSRSRDRRRRSRSRSRRREHGHGRERNERGAREAPRARAESPEEGEALAAPPAPPAPPAPLAPPAPPATGV
jgi:RNA-binding protein Luc7-like 2